MRALPAPFAPPAAQHPRQARGIPGWPPLQPAALAAALAAPVLALVLGMVSLVAAPVAAQMLRDLETPTEGLPRVVTRQPIADLDVNLFPILFYTPETRTGYGVGTWIIHRDAHDSGNGKPDNVWLSAVYTQELQVIVQLIPELFFQSGTYRLKLRMRYLDFPTRFWGIGNNTPASAEELYTPVTRSAYLTFTRLAYDRLSLGLLLDYNDTEIPELQTGGLLDVGGIPGREGSRLAGLGFIASWDSREHHFNPREGSLLEFSLLREVDLDSHAYAFARTGLDLRWYVTVRPNQILSLQGLLQSVGGDAPFSAYPQLGGKFVLRGFFEGRYRDRNLLVLQSEYRVTLGDRWGGALFLSYGDVAETLSSLSLNEFKLGGGLGLRYTYNTVERINLRLDIAVTEESTGIYFSVGEAF